MTRSVAHVFGVMNRSLRRRFRRALLSGRVREILLVFASAIIGVFLRLFRLDGSLLYSDQAFCWRLAKSETVSELLHRVAGDTHPPAYFLLLRYWLDGFGDSVYSIRLLSFVLGILAVLFGVALFRESKLFYGAVNLRSPDSTWLFFCLMAVNFAQIEANRIGRMYALGVLLAVVSSWSLLVALRTASLLRWLLYGILLSMFLYSHNMAFPTAGAHAIVVGLVALRKARESHYREVSRLVLQFSCAAGLAAASYAPWLHNMLAQSARVQNDFWIPNPTFERFSEVVLAWTTGIGYGDGMTYLEESGISRATVGPFSVCILILLEVLLLWVFVKRDHRATFFIILMVAPWVFVLGVTYIAHRSLFLPRYLLFSQIGLFGFVSVAIGHCKPRLRWILSAAVVTATLYGSWLHLLIYPPGPPAIKSAVTFLENNVRAGDVVLVARPKRLLELRYHLSHSRVGKDITVLCPFESREDGGHQNLASAMHAADVIWPDLPPDSVMRIWIGSCLNDHRLIIYDDWSEVLTERFDVTGDVEEPFYELALFKRNELETDIDLTNRDPVRLSAE